MVHGGGLGQGFSHSVRCRLGSGGSPCPGVHRPSSASPGAVGAAASCCFSRSAWRLPFATAAVEIAVILAGILVICVVDELCCRKKLHLPTMIQHQQNAARYLVFYMLIVAIFIFGMYGPGYHAEQFIYMQF